MSCQTPAPVFPSEIFTNTGSSDVSLVESTLNTKTKALPGKFSDCDSCYRYSLDALRSNPYAAEQHIAHLRMHAAYVLLRTKSEWAWAAKNQQTKVSRWTTRSILRWIYGTGHQTWCPIPYTLVLRLVLSSCEWWSVDRLDRWFLDQLTSPRDPLGRCVCGSVVSGTHYGDVVECWHCRTRREMANRRNLNPHLEDLSKFNIGDPSRLVQLVFPWMGVEK